RAAELGRDDAVALSFGGIAQAYVGSDPEGGLVMIDRALTLNSNLAVAWSASGWTRTFLGETELAIEHVRHAMRLSPLDPLMFLMNHITALAHFVGGRCGEAALWAGKALREQPNFLATLRLAAASHALCGHLNQPRRR